MQDYFFDTYALVEIELGNPNYAKYLEANIALTIFNLMELYYAILKDFGEADAEKVFDRYSPYVLEVSDYVLKKAMKYKLLNKTKNLSYVDCIGYVYALEYDMRFLTGDKGFVNRENVEFVSKN